MFEAFKIGVTIALTNTVSSALATMAKDFTKTEAQAQRLRKTLQEIKVLGAVGLASGAMATAFAMPLKSAYEAAKGYTQVFNQFKAMNFGDAVNEQADKFARSARVMGVSSSELMGNIRNLTQVLGDPDKAMSLAPLISQMEFANKAVGGKGFGDNQIKRMAQVIEMRGGFKSPEEMKAQANIMQQVMAGGGYTVNPSDFYAFMQTGGIAAQRLNNEAFYRYSEPLIQEMGGSRFGTGLMTSYNRLVLGVGAGGPSGKAYIETLKNLGLIDPRNIETNKTTGQITKVHSGFLKNTQDYVENPFTYFMNQMLPAMRAHGYGDNKVMEAISQIFGRSGGNDFGKLFLQWEKVQKNIGISSRAMDIPQLTKLALSSPQGSQLALGNAWDSLKTNAGMSLVPLAVRVMVPMAQYFERLAAAFAKHPDLPDRIVKIAGGLTILFASISALSFLGAGIKSVQLIFGFLPGMFRVVAAIGMPAIRALMLLFSPVGGVVAGIALVAYGAYEVWNHWSEIKPKLLSIWHGITDWLSDMVDGILGIKRDKTTGAGGPVQIGPGVQFNQSVNAAQPISSVTVGAPPQANNPIQVNSQINLDGKMVGEATTYHIVNTLDTQPSSGNLFSPRQNMLPVAP